MPHFNTKFGTAYAVTSNSAKMDFQGAVLINGITTDYLIMERLWQNMNGMGSWSQWSETKRLKGDAKGRFTLIAEELTPYQTSQYKVRPTVTYGGFTYRGQESNTVSLKTLCDKPTKPKAPKLGKAVRQEDLELIVNVSRLNIHCSISFFVVKQPLLPYSVFIIVRYHQGCKLLLLRLRLCNVRWETETKTEIP